MAVTQRDKYANIIRVDGSQTSANATKFKEIITGVGLQTRMGMLIDKIEYTPHSGAITELVAVADDMTLGITLANTMASIKAAEVNIVHRMEIKMNFAAAGCFDVRTPFVYDFPVPLIIAQPSIFTCVETSGFAAAATVFFRVYYRYVPLTANEYLEIAETFKAGS